MNKTVATAIWTNYSDK